MCFKYAEDGPTADLTIDSYGTTLAEAFEKVALGMFNAMTPFEKIQKKESMKFEVEGDDIELLLFNFLDELLYLHETELIVFSGFELDIDSVNYKLKSVCQGEAFDLTKHEQGISIKAVTFHNMKITKTENGWTIRVVLDT